VWLNARLGWLGRQHRLRLGILHENHVNYFTHIEFVYDHRMLLDGLGRG